MPVSGIYRVAVRSLNQRSGRPYLIGSSDNYGNVIDFDTFSLVASGDAAATGAITWDGFTTAGYSQTVSANIVFDGFTTDGLGVGGTVGQVAFSDDWLVSGTSYPYIPADGSVLFELFETTGLAVSSTLAIGDILFDGFTVSGRLQLPTIGGVIFDGFEVDGRGGTLSPLYGNILFGGFSIQGTLYSEVPAYVPGADVDEDGYAAWVVNTTTKQHSVYKNFPTTGIAEIDGHWYGLFPDGVYLLEGDDDFYTPIDAKVHWVPSDLGTPQMKRVESLFANIRSTGQIRFVTITDEQERREYVKDLTGYPEGMTRKRQLCTRGLIGQIWQIGIENVDGSDISISDIEVFPIKLQRRLK